MKKHLKNCYFRMGAVSIKKAGKWLTVLLVSLLAGGTAGMIYTNQLSAIRREETALQSEMESLLEEASSQQQLQSSQPEEEGPVNPLTGLPIEEGQEDCRPVAVMINNIKKAQPLLGVQDADILYECLVEGGITRIMAVYQDSQEIPVIGSIRSARPYYIHLASSLDAIYVHVGGSTQAKNLLKKGLVTDYDLGSMEQYMWRDPDRRAEMGYEHSAVTSGQKLTEAMDKKETRVTHKEDIVQPASFSQESPVQEGKDTSNVSVTFSSYKSTDFSYDPQKGSYLVSQFDKPQIDGNTQQQVSKENVVILCINTYPIDDYGLMAMDLAGSGEGYYLHGGKRIEIQWSRKTEDSPFVFTTAQGDPLSFLPGQFYICCVPLESRISFS